MSTDVLTAPKGEHVETIKEALMQWGEAMQVIMENRSMFYSPVLGHWRVKKWAGKGSKSLIYDGDSFTTAFETLLGPHAAEQQRATDVAPPEGR
jgi:hypothetical protein